MSFCGYDVVADTSFQAHLGERLEVLVCENVDATVIGLQVIDLFAKDKSPEVFAEEFDDVESFAKARFVAREAVEKLVRII